MSDNIQFRLFLPAAMVLLALAPDLTAQGKDRLVIDLDPSIEPASVRVAYFLTGPFGGRGDFTNDLKTLRHQLALPLEQDGERATSLKAVVYAKGCAVQTFAMDPLPAAPPRLRFECRKLRTLVLKGVVAGNPRPWELTIQLSYMANWSHAFFGIMDGPILSFPIAEIIPDRDGRFTIEVPDFANDAVTNSYKDKGEGNWLLTALRTGTNDRYWLNTADRKPESPGALTIERDYPEELRFFADPF